MRNDMLEWRDIKVPFRKAETAPVLSYVADARFCVLESGKWGWEKGMTITTWQTDKYQIGSFSTETPSPHVL